MKNPSMKNFPLRDIYNNNNKKIKSENTMISRVR